MKNVVLKNILSLFGIQGMNYLIPLITLPYLVRCLGVESYGELGFTIAFVQYFGLFTEFGFNLSATRKISLHRDDKTQVSKIFWTVISCKVMLATIGLMVLGVLLFTIPMLGDLTWVMLAFYLGIYGNLIFPIWLFQGKEQMGWIAFCNITAKLTSIPLTFLLISDPSDTYLAALILSITNILSGVISIYFVIKNKWITWQKPDIKDLFSEIRGGWYVFISIASTTMYSSGAIVILGFLTNPTVVGLFVAADKFRVIAQGFISPISQAVYPRIVAMLNKDRDEGIVWLRRLLLLQGGGTFLLSLGMFLASKLLIDIMYGAQYKDAIVVLQWLAWMPFVIGVGNVFGVQTLMALGFQKVFGKVHLMCGVISILTLFPLAHYFLAEGAAISALLGESMVTILMMIIVIRKGIPLFSFNK